MRVLITEDQDTLKNSINIPATEMVNTDTYLYKSIKELKKYLTITIFLIKKE